MHDNSGIGGKRSTSVVKALLDVRTAEEFRSGPVPGAVNIPVDELAQRLAELLVE